MKIIKKSKKTQKKLAIVALALEAIIFLLALNIFMQYVSVNNKDDNIYSELNIVDDISCENGLLKVNNISTLVPTNNNVDYKISYNWAESDTAYPSIPHAITAKYYGDAGSTKSLYEITLFRHSYLPKSDIPKGKNSSNWFDTWGTFNDAHGHSNLETKNGISGYYITTINKKSEQDPNPSSYKSTDFYFAADLKDGIAVYILEGILYDKTKQKDFETIYSESLETLKINRQSENQSADDENDRSSNESSNKN